MSLVSYKKVFESTGQEAIDTFHDTMSTVLMSKVYLLILNQFRKWKDKTKQKKKTLDENIELNKTVYNKKTDHAGPISSPWTSSLTQFDN